MRCFRLKKSFKILIILSLSILAFFCVSSLIFPAVSTPKESSNIAVFGDVWQTVNDNFYDPKFNGIDWKAMRSKYEPSVKQAKSLDEVSAVINQMLSELKTSHTRFYTQSEPAYYQLLGIFNNDSFLQEIKRVFPDGNIDYTGIGIFTKEINGKTFISGILGDSPAAKAGLKVGDQILAVDGNKYQAIESFRSKADKEVKLSIQRTPDPSSIQSITVIPDRLKPDTVFLDAMRESVEVSDRGNRKIGYIHIWSYAGDQYQQLLEEEIAFGKLKDADGLVLDLRDGWGGASPNYLNIFANNVPTLTLIDRKGTRRILDYQWKKPVVMVVNEGTRSGKEILADGFQQYDIGAVIGSKTAGAVVAGRPFLMQDGNLLYLAVTDVFVNGERLEGKGIIPDIQVPFQLEYAGGNDPQKEKAVEVLVDVVNRYNLGK